MRTMLIDPTEGMINQRFLLALIMILNDGSDGTEKRRFELSNLIFTTGLMLIAVHGHIKRYGEIEDRLLAKAITNPIDLTSNDPKRIASAQDLYIEFDGLLVQLKSTLDHSINVLNFGFNIPFSALTTFGEKGNKIIKQLENNVAANFQGAANHLIKVIKDNKPWLELAIDVRDRMNHFKSEGIDLQTFTVSAQKVGNEIKTWTPRLHSDQSIRQLMEILYRNLFEFCEYFMALGMMPRLTKVALQYNKSDDPKAMRWKMYPVELVRQFEKDAKPLE
jgi:hypothetical protein